MRISYKAVADYCRHELKGLDESKNQFKCDFYETVMLMIKEIREYERRNKPKIPVFHKFATEYSVGTYFTCPDCNARVNDSMNYCSNCGLEFDWPKECGE